MITLGIETSCDETALALIETRNTDGVFECRVISSLIHSQAELHSQYGGVYPSLAKREHGKNILPLLEKLLNDSKEALGDKGKVLLPEELDKKFSAIKSRFFHQNQDLLSSFTDMDFLRNIPPIDKIAVTEGPGLEPALWVGISFAEILSELWSVPVIPVNHMEGHIVGSLFQSDEKDGQWQTLKPVDFPAVAILVSGGHTELVKIEESRNPGRNFDYTIIGQTKDDAVGEAFDKVARLLDLPYPGGPHISKLAREAREQDISFSKKLPRPMIASNDLDFSFSGLKTAVLYAIRDHKEAGGQVDDSFRKGLAREFEDSVKETLSHKLKKAIEETGAKTVICGGGVIANDTLREAFEGLAKEYNAVIYLPSRHISGDNALMIALAGSLNGGIFKGEIRAQGTKRLS